MCARLLLVRIVLDDFANLYETTSDLAIVNAVKLVGLYVSSLARIGMTDLPLSDS